MNEEPIREFLAVKHSPIIVCQPVYPALVDTPFSSILFNASFLHKHGRVSE